MNNNNQRDTVLFTILCFIGGTTYAVQKAGLEDALPLWSAGVRFLIAGFLMSSITLFSKSFKLNKETVKVSIQYGIFYFALPFGVVYVVGQFLPSGLLSVLSASVAVYAVLFSHFLKGEHVTKSQIIGIVFAMTGVLFIFMQSFYAADHSMSLVALVAALAAYLAAAYATACLKDKITDIYKKPFNAIALLTGGCFLCIISFLTEHGSRLFYGKALFCLLYLALAGSLAATGITTYLMGRWAVAKVTMYRYISPVISLLVGFSFFKEILHFYEVIGVILIMTGIVFINQSQNKLFNRQHKK